MGFADIGNRNWFDENPLPTNAPGGSATFNERPADGQLAVPTTTAPTTGAAGTSNKFAGMDYQQAFTQAAGELNIPLNQTRGRAQEIVDYLAKNGQPGWSASPGADDWIQPPTGVGKDFSQSLSNNFQWIDDPAGNPAGSGGAFGSFSSPYSKAFNVPSGEDAANTPGYKFAFDQGLRGVQSLAAAKGTLLTGGTIKAAEIFGQGLADQTYGNTYDRAYKQYMDSYNMWSRDNNDIWGRYNDVSNRGLTAANAATA